MVGFELGRKRTEDFILTQRKFDADDWIERLAESLEIIAPDVWITVSVESQNGRIITYNEYCMFQELAKQDASIRNKFEVCRVSLKSDPAEVKAILREHPILRPALIGSGNNEGIGVVTPVCWFQIETKTLVADLLKHKFKTDGKCAGKLLHQYLTEGEARKLQARNFTIFYGLKLNGRINLGEGAFLAPFDEAFRATESLSEERWRSFASMGFTRRFQDVSGGNSVFASDLIWGPGVRHEPAAGPENHPDITYAFHIDDTIVMNLLSVAARRPIASYARISCLAKWMHDINSNFGHESLSGQTFATDGFWHEDELSDETAATFQQLVSGWKNFQYQKRERETLSLAVRRIASSFSRAGRLMLEDRILDYAIALEIFYELDNPDMTFKLGTRAAYLLGKTSEERQRIFKTVKDFYSIRSSIVHGKNKRPTLEVLEQTDTNGCDLAIQTLSALLCRGSVPNWTDLVLDGGLSIPEDCTE